VDGIRIAPFRAMAILLWHPAKPRTSNATATLRPGTYAGRARFRPHDVRKLPDALRAALGRVVEVGFAGMAGTDHPFAGQALYLEWCKDDTLDGFLIPEQDLEFLNESSDPRG
jgi:hypothetical protein